MAEMARFAFEFCEVESCGKCTPCRIGSIRGKETVEKVLNGIDVAANIALVEDLCELMTDGSLCAMGGLTPKQLGLARALFLRLVTAEGTRPPTAVTADTAKYWYIMHLDKVVGLTGEQKESMRGIIRVRNKSMWEFQVQNAHRLRAAGNALLAAYRSVAVDRHQQAGAERRGLLEMLNRFLRSPRPGAQACQQRPRGRAACRGCRRPG